MERLEEGLKLLAKLDVSLTQKEISLQDLQSKIYSTVLNVAPHFDHPSDINHVDRIATRLHEEIERVIYCEFEASYIEKGKEVIQKAKEDLKSLYHDYQAKH